MTIFDNIGIKTKGDLAPKIVQAIEDGYDKLRRPVGVVKKVSFSPSSIGYKHNRCPRLWAMKFSGEYTENDKTSLQSLAVMDEGSAAHERIQTALERSGVVRELEQEIKNEDPPIRGFIDVVANFEDMNDPEQDVILELKTTREEAFRSRTVNMKGPAYQMYQVLIYLYLKNLQHGALVYENANDKRLLVIPVEMTEDNRLAVENVFDWMRKVWAAHKDGQMPYRPWKQTSPNCADCPLFEACWDEPREDIKIKSMAVHKW